ncbi:hypothetical protein GFM44_23440 [Rhizobium leguminosarum bv. viciae]|nr:hypothetical protein [Rhizobium leguminosarum bv. viciae]
MIDDLLDTMCIHWNQPRLKDGMVRGTQRYKCLGCGRNFVDAPKNRSLPFQKYLELLMMAREGRHSGNFKSATVDRWILEAKEHRPWFLNVLIWMGVKFSAHSTMFKEIPPDDPERLGMVAVGWVYSAYSAVLKRDPEIHLPKEFRENLIWLLWFAGDDDLKASIHHLTGIDQDGLLAICEASMRHGPPEARKAD